MDWKTLPAYLTGLVDQELLLRNAYLVTENHLLRKRITGRVWLNEGDLAAAVPTPEVSAARLHCSARRCLMLFA
jgi:hypothetical protein